MAKVGEWAKVEDEMPNVNKFTKDLETSEPVIVCDRLGNVFLLAYERFHDKFFWIYGDVCDGIMYRGAAIVAWMPLPNPPGGENN